MRFLALLSLFLLSACSYDPYHYYYKCEGRTDDGGPLNGRPLKSSYHIHNKILTDKFDAVYRWKSETRVNTTYEHLRKMTYGDDYYSYQLHINKIDNSLLNIVYDNKGIVAGSSNWTCSVEKTLFKK